MRFFVNPQGQNPPLDLHHPLTDVRHPEGPAPMNRTHPMRAYALALTLLATPATAQDNAVQTALASLPAPVADRITADPTRFATRAMDMIHAHGGAGGLTAADVDRALALDRAFFRARALRPMQEADLDADGSVTSDEIAARAAVLGADGRSRLMRAHATADSDSDGSVSASELRAGAEAAAQSGVSDRDVADARAILAFDLDGDGRTAPAEIAMTAAALAAPSANGG